MAHRKRTEMKMFESRMLNSSTTRAFPTSPDQSLGLRSPICAAANEASRVPMVIQFGNRGSRAMPNLDPPRSTGTLKEVRGILNLASPKFGTMIRATRPTSMMISGRRSSVGIPASSELMA
jgi:hypothetical protein